ncbi:MAG: hypothetical protein Q8L19_20625 [Reyranella sp.]|nr:hypothetical protein [Reyranella sp.]
MSKTALIEAVKTFDVDSVGAILKTDPSLAKWRSSQGFNLLQFCCSRCTADKKATPKKGLPPPARQLRLAKWLVAQGFDPLVIHTTKPGEDGEADPAELSLVFFAVARAQNNALARYFLKQGAHPGAVFAAVWWGNWEILPDLVRHGADLDQVVGATPLHMALVLWMKAVDTKPDQVSRRMKTFKTLIRLGANPDVRAQTKEPRSVRELAARKRDKRYVGALGQQEIKS